MKEEEGGGNRCTKGGVLGELIRGLVRHRLNFSTGGRFAYRRRAEKKAGLWEITEALGHPI